ncbi:hypothetical protein HDU96_004240 [Phlyctochytrium bullatum]|nr:hypothetical protein HDU96_004240 [Phlyctochytrium bullatum]
MTGKDWAHASVGDLDVDPLAWASDVGLAPPASPTPSMPHSPVLEPVTHASPAMEDDDADGTSEHGSLPQPSPLRHGGFAALHAMHPDSTSREHWAKPAGLSIQVSAPDREPYAAGPVSSFVSPHTPPVMRSPTAIRPSPFHFEPLRHQVPQHQPTLDHTSPNAMLRTLHASPTPTHHPASHPTSPTSRRRSFQAPNAKSSSMTSYLPSPPHTPSNEPAGAAPATTASSPLAPYFADAYARHHHPRGGPALAVPHSPGLPPDPTPDPSTRQRSHSPIASPRPVRPMPHPVDEVYYAASPAEGIVSPEAPPAPAPPTNAGTYGFHVSQRLVEPHLPPLAFTPPAPYSASPVAGTSANAATPARRASLTYWDGASAGAAAQPRPAGAAAQPRPAVGLGLIQEVHGGGGTGDEPHRGRAHARWPIPGPGSGAEDPWLAYPPGEPAHPLLTAPRFATGRRHSLPAEARAPEPPPPATGTATPGRGGGRPVPRRTGGPGPGMAIRSLSMTDSPAGGGVATEPFAVTATASPALTGSSVAWSAASSPWLRGDTTPVLSRGGSVDEESSGVGAGLALRARQFAEVSSSPLRMEAVPLHDDDGGSEEEEEEEEEEGMAVRRREARTSVDVKGKRASWCLPSEEASGVGEAEAIYIPEEAYLYAGEFHPGLLEHMASAQPFDEGVGPRGPGVEEDEIRASWLRSTLAAQAALWPGEGIASTSAAAVVGGGAMARKSFIAAATAGNMDRGTAAAFRAAMAVAEESVTAAAAQAFEQVYGVLAGGPYEGTSRLSTWIKNEDDVGGSAVGAVSDPVSWMDAVAAWGRRTAAEAADVCRWLGEGTRDVEHGVTDPTGGVVGARVPTNLLTVLFGMVVVVCLAFPPAILLAILVGVGWRTWRSFVEVVSRQDAGEVVGRAVAEAVVVVKGGMDKAWGVVLGVVGMRWVSAAGRRVEVLVRRGVRRVWAVVVDGSSSSRPAEVV